jgi:beta-glucanase (GH16 family)
LLLIGGACVVIAPWLSSPESPSSAPPPEVEPNGPNLIWGDEFEGPSGMPPDPDLWTHETGGGGWGNDELQYYTDSTDNSSLDGQGHLLLTARQVDPATAGLECWYGGCAFTSARLTTEDKQVWEHGRIEARVKVPEGGGIWPAVWMLGADIRDVGWPQAGEVDVMEFVGKSPDEVFGTLHGPGYSGGQSFGGAQDLEAPVGADWHIFTVEWSAGLIVWKVDDIEYHRATPRDVAPNEWVFEDPFFLLTNMAVGGNFAGAVAEGTEFPKTLSIDYIRCYQIRVGSD